MYSFSNLASRSIASEITLVTSPYRAMPKAAKSSAKVSKKITAHASKAPKIDKHAAAMPTAKQAKAKSKPDEDETSKRALVKRDTLAEAERAVDKKLWWLPADIRHTSKNSKGENPIEMAAAQMRKNRCNKSHLKEPFWLEVLCIRSIGTATETCSLRMNGNSTSCTINVNHFIVLYY